MENVTINEIDKLIENSKNYSSSEKFLTELSKLIVTFLNIETETINHNSILKKELNQNNKRFISFCLLRVYMINSKLITNRSVKHSIHNLFEKSIPDVYKKLKITTKTETYEIENKLSSYVSNIEQDIKNKINVDIDLKSINAYKNTYLSTINHTQNKPLISNFLDGINIKQYSEKAFNLTIQYIDSNKLDKFNIYKSAIKAIDNCIDKAKEINTKYSIEYIEKPFNILKTKLLNDFESNPFSKPALLEIIKTEKKYPITPDISHNLQLLIKNTSTGYAYETIIQITDVESIKIKEKEKYIGTIKDYSYIEFEYIGVKQSNSFLIEGIVEWSNFNGEKVKKDFLIELESQSSKINWQEIETIEPYDLEPVSNENEFIGRKKIISELKKTRKKVSSSYIFGQRRVGKTSIVKTLQSSYKADNTLVIYFEAGDWNNASSPKESMNDLGEKICYKIKKIKKFNSIPVPNFNGSFSRITNFLDEVIEIDNNFRTLIILDEFDRISNELLFQGDIAKSFTLTIRSISNREQFGFILVGGEKLEYILSQWQEFNKFKPIRVDYFDKKSEWEDFKDLIKVPIKDIFEISDKAIDYLYTQTSGNPYFTKKICIELFSLMVNNRDSHITEVEVKEATRIACDINNIGATDFSHFWKDGIKEKEEKEEQISINRRKVLLAIGQILKNNNKATKQLIIDKSIENGLNELEAEKTLEEFIQRKIVASENNKYQFVVKFFQDWLINNGLDKIITTFEEEQRILLRQKYEEEIKVKHNELNILTQSWSVYKGKELTTDIIREYLEQFNNIEEQRLIFKILSNLKFYSNIEIREKMEDLFREVRKEIRNYNKEIHLSSNKRKRDDIIVSFLDNSPAKSGSEYGKIFIETNGIYKDNSISPNKLEQKINNFTNLNAIVFIDDFLGTGNSIIENIKQTIIPIKDIINERNIIIIIGLITGFQEAKRRIERFAKRNDIKVEIKVLDPLDDSDKCFNENSLIFTQPLEREKARELCYKKGLLLEKKYPLGYGDCQATIVFPNTCPNNSLPILWKETNNWKPLFKRG